MEHNIDLKRIEKETWFTAVTQDGLFDIMFGIMILAMSLTFFTDRFLGAPWRSMLFPGIALAVVFAGKHFITRPRIGIVEFGRERQVKSARAFAFLAVVVAAQLLLITTMSGGPGNALNRLAIPIAMGITVFAILAVLAYMLDLPRFYIYGAIMGIGIPLTEVLYNVVGEPLDNAIAFGIPGIFVLAFGMAKLAGFVKRHPLPARG